MSALAPTIFSPPEADEKGLEPTAAFDVYSLGKVIYYLLAGSLLRRERFADPEFEVGEVLGRPDLHVVTERVLSRPDCRSTVESGSDNGRGSPSSRFGNGRLVGQAGAGLAVASLPATEAKGTVGP